MKLIFGLDRVASEFELKGSRIDTLAFDRDSKVFVIIKYKKDRNVSGLVEQGLSYLRLMLDNTGEILRVR